MICIVLHGPVRAIERNTVLVHNQGCGAIILRPFFIALFRPPANLHFGDQGLTTRTLMERLGSGPSVPVGLLERTQLCAAEGTFWVVDVERSSYLAGVGSAFGCNEQEICGFRHGWCS